MPAHKMVSHDEGDRTLIGRSVWFVCPISFCREPGDHNPIPHRLDRDVVYRFQHAMRNSGREGRIRTDDPSLPKRVRYQAALLPELLNSHSKGLAPSQP